MPGAAQNSTNVRSFNPQIDLTGREIESKIVQSHTQGHTAGKWQSWGVNPGNPAGTLNTYILKSSKMIVLFCFALVFVLFVRFFKVRTPSQQLLSSSCLPYLCAISPGVYSYLHFPRKLRHKGVTLGVEMDVCPK